MTQRLDALHASVDRLAGVVGTLEPAGLTAPAYPPAWTIADTLSHLGSGAVIFLRLVDGSLAGTETPGDAFPAVWDEWNAKSPARQGADSLVADRALLDRLEGLDADERHRFRTTLGPMDVDFATLVALRLNEHALHTWDVEVAVDPAATVGPEATACVIDGLERVAAFTARPTGADRTVQLVTTDPARGATVVLGADAVTFTSGDPVDAPDLVLPAEACIRLVYGRLDPGHAGGVRESPLLDELRRAFPGV
jgi:uncharacterized protein (TIGR03083 family)